MASAYCGEGQVLAFVYFGRGEVLVFVCSHLWLQVHHYLAMQGDDDCIHTPGNFCAAMVCSTYVNACCEAY